MRLYTLAFSALLSLSAQAQDQTTTIAQELGSGDCVLKLTGNAIKIPKGYRSVQVDQDLTLSIFRANSRDLLIPTRSSFSVDKRQTRYGCLTLQDMEVDLCSTKVDLVFSKANKFSALTNGQFVLECRRYR